MTTVPYFGIIRDDQFLVTTVKTDNERAELNISLQLNSWMKIYPFSKLRIAKIAKRNEHGWEEA